MLTALTPGPALAAVRELCASAALGAEKGSTGDRTPSEDLTKAVVFSAVLLLPC